MNLKPPKIERGRAKMLAGLRRHHSFAGASRSVPDQWSAFRRLDRLPRQIGETVYGAMCAYDAVQERFEYLAGVEVSTFEALDDSIGRMRVPAQWYAVFTHSGHVSGLQAMWGVVWNAWLPRSGYTPAPTPDFELYDERFDPETGAGKIEIWFPLVEGCNHR